MPNAIVHFEIIGRDAPKLREFYSAVFGWRFDTDSPVSPAVSDAGNYGFTTSTVGDGVPGGVGGGPAFEPHCIIYIGVEDVEKALQDVVRLGGKRVFGPERSPGTSLVVGQFTDPEGTLVGVAGSN